MDNVSIGLSKELIVDRLISNVRVRITRSGYTNYKDKQHRGISADILARKWGILLYKANLTLQSKTQDNVRSSLNPLTRRYRTYFLPQRLSRLNFRFYMDTLFVKYKFIVGNTCAQIFTDRDFSNNLHWEQHYTG